MTLATDEIQTNPASCRPRLMKSGLFVLSIQWCPRSRLRSETIAVRGILPELEEMLGRFSWAMQGLWFAVTVRREVGPCS